MKQPLYSVRTLGCRLNQYESAELEYELERAGLKKSARLGESDFIIVNSCAVTDRAQAKTRALVRRLRRAAPGAKVTLTGCYAALGSDEIKDRLGVDLLLDGRSKFSIARALGAPGATGTHKAPGPFDQRPIRAIAGRTNLYLKVQLGCSQNCSFCSIRIARGESRSADPDQLALAVRRMVDSGAREIVLTGIDLGDYSGGSLNLAGLTRKLLTETKIARIRYSSINPNHIDSKLIDLISSERRICRYLHVPLQSGSDKILKLMNRPYSAAEYSRILDELAARVDGIGLGADIMVGFPYETDADFKATVALLEQSPLTRAHIFPFAAREKTQAYSIRSKAPGPTASRERAAILKEIFDRKFDRFARAHIGARLQVLTEKKNRSQTGWRGRADNYLPVEFEQLDGAVNRLVDLKVERVKGEGSAGSLVGSPIQSEPGRGGSIRD